MSSINLDASDGLQPYLIPAETVAKLLDISTRTLWRMRSAGTLPPPVKLGGVVRWRLDQLVEWIESGCPADHHFEPDVRK